MKIFIHFLHYRNDTNVFFVYILLKYFLLDISSVFNQAMIRNTGIYLVIVFEAWFIFKMLIDLLEARTGEKVHKAIRRKYYWFLGLVDLLLYLRHIPYYMERIYLSSYQTEYK